MEKPFVPTKPDTKVAVTDGKNLELHDYEGLIKNPKERELMMKKDVFLHEIVSMAFKELPKDEAEYFATVLGAMARKAIDPDFKPKQAEDDNAGLPDNGNMAVDSLPEKEVVYEGKLAGLNNYKPDAFYEVKKRKIIEGQIANLKDWTKEEDSRFHGLDSIKIGNNPVEFG